MGKQVYSDARQLVRALLKQARIEAGLSQVVLGERLSRPQSYVSEYESSTRGLDWVDVTEILDACGYDLLQFSKDYLAGRRKLPKS